MQNDILPPEPRPNIKTPAKRPMGSLRLQGHSADAAKKRLLGTNEQSASHPKAPQQAVENIEIDGTKIESKKKKRSFSSIKKTWNGYSKRKKITLGTLGSVLVVLMSLGVFSLFQPEESVPVAQNVVEVAPPTPDTVASPLTGLQVKPSLAKRPVTGIMIENSLDARPQSGLQDAGVVYEAIAEGGITRFMALFQEAQPDYVGPVRSLRPYYLDFAAPFEASIAHVGGSPDALKQVRNGKYRDIDQFFNADTYWRASTRYAPHNVYTSFKNIDKLNKQKKYTSSSFTPWTRKDESPASKPTATKIDFSISSDLYNSHYDYDKKTNTYSRSEGGRPHIGTSSERDSKGKRLRPKVVIALVMDYSIVDSSGHSGYGVTGKGQMYLFQDGKVVKGTWKKLDRKNQFKFADKSGKTLLLNAGQVWITIVKSKSEISYKS